MCRRCVLRPLQAVSPIDDGGLGRVVSDAVVGESVCQLDTEYITCLAGPAGRRPSWFDVSDCMDIDGDYTCTQVDQNEGYHGERWWDR